MVTTHADAPISESVVQCQQAAVCTIQLACRPVLEDMSFHLVFLFFELHSYDQRSADSCKKLM